jgi:hypothetical protein
MVPFWDVMAVRALSGSSSGSGVGGSNRADAAAQYTMHNTNRPERRMRSGARVAGHIAVTIDSRGTVLTFRPPTTLVPASEMGLFTLSSSTPSLSLPRLFKLFPLPNPSRRRLTLLVRIEPFRLLSCPGGEPESPPPMPTRDEDATAFRSAIDMSLRIGDS